MTILMDSFRRDIIDRFRSRIAQGDRLRLSKEDLLELIADFIEQLRVMNSEADIRTLCEAEIKLLEEGYPQATVAKYLTTYRKAIMEAISAEFLSITADNSHRFVHQQRVTGVREERLEHWALTYLKYAPEVYETIDRRSQLTNRGKQLNLRLVPVDRYLDLLQGLLHSQGTFTARWLAVAIAGLTGRRFAEVLAKGTLTLTEHPYLLHFEGQLKSKAARPEGYDIVTLLPAETVLDAMMQLRGMPEVKAIARLKGKALSEALNLFNRKLNSMCGSVLAEIVPPLEGKKNVSVHNLRSLYGAIAVYLFCPPYQHEYAFIQHFLGHVMDSPATGHYFRYALSDKQGQLLRDKGVLLTTVEALPLEVQESSPLDVVAVQKPVTLSKMISPERQTAIKASKTNTTHMNVQQDTQLSLSMLAQNEPDPNQSIPAQWLELLNRELASLRAELENRLIRLEQRTEADWWVRQIETLETENIQLKQAKDLAIQENQDHTKTIKRLEFDQAVLTQQLQQAQAKLDRLGQLLNSNEMEEAHHLEEEPKGVSSEAVSIQKEEMLREAIAAHQEAATNPETVRLPTKSQHEASASLPPISTTPRGPKVGKAFKRAESIFLAIKDWNQRYPAESFAINPGLLEMVFKVHRQAAKDFFEAYQNELWEYHLEIGVESPRWHNRGKDTQRLKAFVDAQKG